MDEDPGTITTRRMQTSNKHVATRALTARSVGRKGARTLSNQRLQARGFPDKPFLHKSPLRRTNAEPSSSCRQLFLHLRCHGTPRRSTTGDAVYHLPSRCSQLSGHLSGHPSGHLRMCDWSVGQRMCTSTLLQVSTTGVQRCGSGIS